MIRIGNVELKNNVIMAPMAGITDTAYRIILEEMGVGLVSTEMVSARLTHPCRRCLVSYSRES